MLYYTDNSMQSLAIHSKALLFVAIAWNEFLPWYIVYHPIHIVKTYIGFSKVAFEYFSFVFLLKTLFKPWKSISDAYPENMLNIVVVFQVLTMNLTARGVGFVVRILTIITGILAQIALLAFFVLYLVLWFLYPISVLVSVPYLVSSLLVL